MKNLTTEIEYGEWKFITDITLCDLSKYPVWVWCAEVDHDCVPDGGDETSMRPILNSNQVPLDHTWPPLLLLAVEQKNYFARGLFDNEKKTIDAISILIDKEMFCPKSILTDCHKVVYRVIPEIHGQEGMRFCSDSSDLDHASKM